MECDGANAWSVTRQLAFLHWLCDSPGEDIFDSDIITQVPPSGLNPRRPFQTSSHAEQPSTNANTKARYHMVQNLNGETAICLI